MPDESGMKTPAPIAPLRQDPPGAISNMPSPHMLHHVHIFSDENYDAMVEFYTRLFNTETTAENTNKGGARLTFLAFDDYDHRVIIIKRPGWGTKPERPVGISHLAFGYKSLGELLYVYKSMKQWGYEKPHWTVNHGNSTSLYYRDPDGNEVETLVDNFPPIEAKNYKKYYQFSEAFGEMDEGNFDPDKMVALYESGMPDTMLLDREEVRKMVREGRL